MSLVYVVKSRENELEEVVEAMYPRRHEKYNNNVERVVIPIRMEKPLYNRLMALKSSQNASINALLKYALDTLDTSNNRLIAWQPK